MLVRVSSGEAYQSFYAALSPSRRRQLSNRHQGTSTKPLGPSQICHVTSVHLQSDRNDAKILLRIWSSYQLVSQKLQQHFKMPGTYMQTLVWFILNHDLLFSTPENMCAPVVCAYFSSAIQKISHSIKTHSPFYIIFILSNRSVVFRNLHLLFDFADIFFVLFYTGASYFSTFWMGLWTEFALYLPASSKLPKWQIWLMLLIQSFISSSVLATR